MWLTRCIFRPQSAGYDSTDEDTAIVPDDHIAHLPFMTVGKCGRSFENCWTGDLSRAKQDFTSRSDLLSRGILHHLHTDGALAFKQDSICHYSGDHRQVGPIHRRAQKKSPRSGVSLSKSNAALSQCQHHRRAQLHGSFSDLLRLSQLAQRRA